LELNFFKNNQDGISTRKLRFSSSPVEGVAGYLLMDKFNPQVPFAAGLNSKSEIRRLNVRAVGIHPRLSVTTQERNLILNRL
jgi:hypothetical protein